MKMLKTLSKKVRDTLSDWGYAHGDFIKPIDMYYAMYRCTSYRMIDVCTTCMCLDGVLTDFGDGIFMLNGKK